MVPPVSTAKQDDPTYMAVIIGVLTAVILLLAVAIFLIVTRHRSRKNFASPLGTKSALPPGAHHHHLANESAYGTAEKDPSLMTYRVEELEDRYAGAKLTTLPRELNDRLLGDVRLDDYQEPFHESGSGKYREPLHAAYYGYSTVVIDNKDLHDSVDQSGEPPTDYIYTAFVWKLWSACVCVRACCEWARLREGDPSLTFALNAFIYEMEEANIFPQTRLRCCKLSFLLRSLGKLSLGLLKD